MALQNRHDVPGSTLSSFDNADKNEEVQVPKNTTERRLMARIDLHVVPYLCILYVFAFLDRVNIANAAVFGLRKELKLTGVQYNTALTIFFVPYVVFEIPSNIILKKLKPHVWLSACMFMFGLVTVCQGLVHSYSGLLATRFFLGFFETGMFPGCFYLISMWYKRTEAQKRYTFFFSSTTLAGAFGGLLASAIGKMEGMRGFRGWRWIFILEGVLTCVVALAFFFLLPDFPERSKWLTEEERVYVVARLRSDQGKSEVEKPIKARDVVNVFRDWKVFAGGFMYFGMIVPAYGPPFFTHPQQNAGYAYFAPTIIQQFGYSPIETQLHSVPPWACAFAFAMLTAALSDRLSHRYLFTLLPTLLAITGFIILLTVHHHPRLQYAALFLVVMGCWSAMPVIICWFSMNLGGHHRRAVGTAWQIGFGNVGGFISTYAFLVKDAPEYRPGYGVCMGFCGVSIMACAAYFWGVWGENKRRKRERMIMGGFGGEGDLRTEFRYQL
ncbi:hypothetical protein FGG08_005597 [Glutinoglossum americanum]|uniref:Major facilitator superfamily (MFS) profile domain-containing protein n=1 Tax=Glutinoglossum americanum TaxID=1670608 RepID=A0A9P8I395_9PEZI|nr:hypothetical protein FGG08_005597 [Glutinoglossum americanum]